MGLGSALAAAFAAAACACLPSCWRNVLQQRLPSLEADATRAAHLHHTKLAQHTLKRNTSFKSYLFTIAYNEICNVFRQRSYLRQYIASSLKSNHEASGDSEAQLDALFIREQVDQIISKLPEKQRIIFLKSRQEGKSTRDIAAELSLSPGTVDNYLSESLKFIRLHLEDRNIAGLLFISLYFV